MTADAVDVEAVLAGDEELLERGVRVAEVDAHDPRRAADRPVVEAAVDVFCAKFIVSAVDVPNVVGVASLVPRMVSFTLPPLFVAATYA